MTKLGREGRDGRTVTRAAEQLCAVDLLSKKRVYFSRRQGVTRLLYTVRVSRERDR